MTKRILLASGQSVIDSTILKFGGYENVGVCDYKNQVFEKCEELNPEILIIGEALGGNESLAGIILRIAQKMPSTRIIYLPGKINYGDEVQMSALNLLIEAGIYDIVLEETVNEAYLRNFLEYPRTKDSLKNITQKASKVVHKQNTGVTFIQSLESLDEDPSIIKNLFVVSSIKPGTGKSFLSTNIATAIAQFGKPNEKGKKPKVALIEADLQNLSVGTLLGIEDDKKHLKSVMDRISTIISENGEAIGSHEDFEKCDDYILSCFKPYKEVKNLEALVGSQLKYADLEKVKPAFYAYLMDMVTRHYDVVIVDSNSSLGHVTTAPILAMAKSCFYVLNLDFNNIRNNIRYRDTLAEMGIQHKVQYILNEDIKNETVDGEKLIFTAENLDDSELRVSASIPLLQKNIFLNRLYEGIPVVLDKTKDTLNARLELLKAATLIYPVNGIEELEKEVAKNKKKKGLFGKK